MTWILPANDDVVVLAASPLAFAAAGWIVWRVSRTDAYRGAAMGASLGLVSGLTILAYAGFGDDAFVFDWILGAGVTTGGSLCVVWLLRLQYGESPIFDFFRETYPDAFVLENHDTQFICPSRIIRIRASGQAVVQFRFQSCVDAERTVEVALTPRRPIFGREGFPEPVTTTIELAPFEAGTLELEVPVNDERPAVTWIIAVRGRGPRGYRGRPRRGTRHRPPKLGAGWVNPDGGSITRQEGIAFFELRLDAEAPERPEVTPGFETTWQLDPSYQAAPSTR